MAHAGRPALFQKLLMGHPTADTGSRSQIEMMSPRCSFNRHMMLAQLQVVTFPFRVQVKLRFSSGATGVTGAGDRWGGTHRFYKGRCWRSQVKPHRIMKPPDKPHQCSDRHAPQQPCNTELFLSLVATQNSAPREI